VSSRDCTRPSTARLLLHVRDVAGVLARALCVVGLAGCAAHSKAERPRAALKNAAWFVGGAVVGGSGYWVIRDVRGADDSGLGGPTGAMLLGTGIAMAFGATLGLLGVAFDDVPDR
jgi:hypothetical protein